MSTAKKLQQSHFIAKGFYTALKKSETPHDTEPVLADLKSGTALMTSQQPQQHLLCSDCETKFQKFGEDPVIRDCYRNSNKFPLRDKLRNKEHNKIVEGRRLWRRDQICNSVDVDTYAYFALSIAWRGSIANWGKYSKARRNGLGKKYTDSFRHYLFERSEFPDKTAVFVYVDFDEPAHPTIAFPAYDSICLEGRRLHEVQFMVPGLKFIVLYGGGTNKVISKLTNSSSDKAFIWEWSFKKSDSFRKMASNVGVLQSKGKLADNGG